MMRQGLFLPAFDGLSDPAALAELAVVAERAGWDGMFLWDHLLYTEPVRDILDPWICLAAMAVRTSSILLGPMVTPLVRRRPAVVARQAVTLDLLAQGRLVLGFGIGDDGRLGELSRFGDESDALVRGEALSEGLEVLVGLLSGEEIHHVGAHYRADGVRFLPAQRPGGIPIWLAARWPNRRPLRRAAHYDGVVVIQLNDPADVHELRERVREERGQLDGFDVVIQRPYGEDPAPWAAVGVTWLLSLIGPYDLRYDEVHAAISAGPRPLIIQS